MITAATVVIRELFVRLTCDPGALKTSLKLPPLARVERRVNEDFTTGAVTRDLFRGKYSFRTLNYIVIPVEGGGAGRGGEGLPPASRARRVDSSINLSRFNNVL